MLELQAASILPCEGRWQREALTDGYPPLGKATPLHPLQGRIV
jgi:hypothetical protein